MRSAALLCAAAGLVWAQTGPGLTSMSEKQANQMMLSMRVNGQVGGSLDFRVRSTDRSYNYKLRATWITPDVALAAARVLMLAKGFSQAQAQEVIEAASAPDSWLVLVELDPREGSGVIPRDWTARFGLRDSESRQALGQEVVAQGIWRSFLSAFPRDYSYDVFLMRFPRNDPGGAGLLQPGDAEAELLVRIYSKGGRVRWKIPTGLVR
jgi:hypothetical protein